MTVNNTEINGFTIDQFNQYDLTVGKKEGVCPLCSADRKPENRKAKMCYVRLGTWSWYLYEL